VWRDLPWRVGSPDQPAEMYRHLQTLRRVHATPGNRSIGWGDESEGLWMPLLVPWDASVPLTPTTVLEALRAHPALASSTEVHNVYDDDDDDDARAYWRQGPRDWQMKSWREASAAAGAAGLDYSLAPSFKLALRALWARTDPPSYLLRAVTRSPRLLTATIS